MPTSSPEMRSRGLKQTPEYFPHSFIQLRNQSLQDTLICTYILCNEAEVTETNFE